MRYAVLLLLLALPCSAEAPPEVLIRPVAQCSNGKCVMDEKDFKKLQEFHAQRLQQLKIAQEVLDTVNAENKQLWALINRLGTCGRHI